MKAAIIGYGKMGREIEKILRERGHEVGVIIDVVDHGPWTMGHEKALRECDVALEFTQPEAACENVRRCLDLGVAVLSGTTGWGVQLQEMQGYCLEKGGAMFYASNYCLGVNLMFRLNRQLAEMVGRVGGDYEISIEEVHHIHKKDAPSGTAITLADGIAAQGAPRPEITSVREGEVPGIHTVRYEAADERLEIRHEIKNRRVLALGAVLAAEFLCGKKGVFSMDDLF